ncbi:Na(+)/H(+) antiporter 1 [Cytospora mali]|uniref:Na(+)/H(+) antiporter 1 n=1 Tax=Cytospora mali TaxID=578113 RepID=A0A194VUA3_CYTMA|nr:Na(+)/H(+) antiporter 1 [Valsa mali]
MPTLAVNNFNIFVSVLGGWVSLFGLVSYLCKENFYLSEACECQPRPAVRPDGSLLFSLVGSQENLDSIILYFSRLVLGVQLVLAGVQLPSQYLKRQWKPLSILLGPVMTAMWLSTSLLVWALVPDLPILHSLAIGACVTPTDPILSNVIVKGKFADHNVPKDLQRIIIAESGANDGLGYPFLFLALYLIKYIGDGGASAPGGAGKAMGLWFGETWGYTIILSVIYGATVGWIAKELLHWAEEHKFVDRESFLVFAFSLALFIVGTCGMIGSDDVLACFIAGNTFTWDDWFRLETMDDSLQPTVDMLLNVSIFMWYGAVCPWEMFLDNNVIPLGRLMGLGVLILLLRRLPWVFAIHKKIPQIEHIQHAVFVGFFGPVGVSAIFYLYITREFVDTLKGHNGEIRSDVAKLPEAVLVIVWFLCICSVVVHGLSIPLGKLGWNLPRTLSRGHTDEPDSAAPFSIGSRANSLVLRLPTFSASRRRSSGDCGQTSSSSHAVSPGAPRADAVSHRPMWHIGGAVIRGREERQQREQGQQETHQLGVLPARSMSPLAMNDGSEDVGSGRRRSDGIMQEGEGGGGSPALGPASRTIRFPDEAYA